MVIGLDLNSIKTLNPGIIAISILIPESQTLLRPSLQGAVFIHKAASPENAVDCSGLRKESGNHLMNQQDYYRALLSQKKDIKQQINRKREILQTPLSESTDELSAYDQHPGDLASDTFEREKETGLLEVLEFEMKKIDDALLHFQKGTYGICDKCGQQIEPARLQRLPNTSFCAECARSQVNHFRRPAEEDVIRPGIAYNMGFDVAGFGYNNYSETINKADVYSEKKPSEDR
ncbi:MAG: TraR/DksA C4-type zinc finger protein [Syntrophomonas sp.]|nr:TraR/DksA C4-type zinc finger protein [Syntrophomonas sp.]